MVLRNIAETYWLPGIAEAARNLLEGRPSVVSPPNMPGQDPLTNFCARKEDTALLRKCIDNSDPKDIERYNQEGETYWHRLRQDFLNHPSLRGAQPPELTLETEDGKLIGTDHGEWGGELGFVNDRSTQTVIDDNVLAIVRRGSRILAVTGLNHGGLNRGYIWSPSGQWSARRLWRLPGTPYTIAVAPDGTIGLFGRSGSALYTIDDKLQWIACGHPTVAANEGKPE